MANISFKNQAIMEELFGMNNGYVLNLSNNQFKNLVAKHANIDVYQDSRYIIESSKAKKLRKIWDFENDQIVGEIILDLLEHREAIIVLKTEYDNDYKDPLASQAIAIKELANGMISKKHDYLTNDERLMIDISAAESVLDDLIKIGEQACNNVSYNAKSKENTINDYFRDMLRSKGYTEIKDQTRHGVSSSGKDAGEVDILISKNNKEIAIIEALKLNSVDSDYIKEHIEKAIINYNPLGTATFIVAYVSAADFGGFWKRYSDYLMNYKFNVTVKEPFSIKPHPNAAIRFARCILSKDNYDFPVFFLAIKLN